MEAEPIELIEKTKLRSKEMAITLNNGFKMPLIGLGVWRMEKQQVRDLIINAIKIGYRHFDCAGTLFSCFIPFLTSFSLDIIIFSSIRWIWFNFIFLVYNLRMKSKSWIISDSGSYFLNFLELGCVEIVGGIECQNAWYLILEYL